MLQGELLIWRTKNQVWDQGIGPTQGLNLLQISPNWFLGNWTLDFHLKWALVTPYENNASSINFSSNFEITNLKEQKDYP